MATSIIINLFALPQVNPGCKFNSTRHNEMFLYMVVIAETVVRIVCLAYSRRGTGVQQRSLLVKSLQGLLYSAWVVYCTVDFKQFSPHCYDPYPSGSLVLYSVLLCYVLPQAFVILCFLMLIVIFCPCLTCAAYAEFNRSSETHRIKKSVIEHLPKIPFSSMVFNE